MSDTDTGGYDGGHEVDYGHYQDGNEHAALDQLHQAQGSEHDYGNQYGVYENDHHAAENTDFSQGHHTEYDQAPAIHAESDDYTNYHHDGDVDDHVFAAEGSEHAHDANFSELDALQQRFDAGFAEGTQYHADGGEAGLGIASK
jgi:hypothetical protein